MWRYASGFAVIAGLLCLPAPSQTPANAKDADKGYTPVRLWERADVRATRVEIKANTVRAIHQHDDVKFHLFIPLKGMLQLSIRSDKPIDAPVGQAFYIKGGTPPRIPEHRVDAGRGDGDFCEGRRLHRQPGCTGHPGRRAAKCAADSLGRLCWTNQPRHRCSAIA